MTSRLYQFAHFRLDERSGLLWHESQQCPLRPKTFALLHYLLTRRGDLVSKREILSALWPEVKVREAALAVCVHELRQVLGDHWRSPRFIETRHRRGYRFIAPVATTESAGELPPSETSPSQPAPSLVVGRDAELVRLQDSWALALSGKRQVMFISGEPGIGKTTLVDCFRGLIKPGSGVVWGQGQCLEQFGKGEPYLPILEGLDQMGRSSAGAEVRNLLRDRAPGWLPHLPGLVDRHVAETVKLSVARARRERMMREMAESLELLAAARPVVLVCEDLHFSDRSTVDLIAYLAARREPARLMIIATYRSTEHNLPARRLGAVVQELQTHQQCQELRLELLGEAAVTEFLRRRIRKDVVSLGLAHQVFQRTEGNPLFMAALVEHLVAQNGHQRARQAASRRWYRYRTRLLG